MSLTTSFDMNYKIMSDLYLLSIEMKDCWIDVDHNVPYPPWAVPRLSKLFTIKPPYTNLAWILPQPRAKKYNSGVVLLVRSNWNTTIFHLIICLYRINMQWACKNGKKKE